MTFSYPSGEYLLTDSKGKKTTIFLGKNQAKFMNGAFIRLGFDQIECVKEIHPTDIPMTERY